MSASEAVSYWLILSYTSLSLRYTSLLKTQLRWICLMSFWVSSKRAFVYFTFRFTLAMFCLSPYSCSPYSRGTRSSSMNYSHFSTVTSSAKYSA